MATDSSPGSPPTTEPVVKQNVHEDYRVSSPEWQAPQQANSFPSPGSPLQSLAPGNSSLTTMDVTQEAGEKSQGAMLGQPQASPSAPTPLHHAPTFPESSRRDYPALVAALQTLGYSVPGFVATAIVSLDGQPIAQVAVDELDISPMCGYFSAVLQGALLSLDSGRWSSYEDTVITSAAYHILLRIVDSEREVFQVLITTREANPAESLEVMANVEGAIETALG